MTEKQREILLALGKALQAAVEGQANDVRLFRETLVVFEAHWQHLLSLEAKIAMCLAVVATEEEHDDGQAAHTDRVPA